MPRFPHRSHCAKINLWWCLVTRLEALAQIAEDHGVALVYLFGSQADRAYRYLLGEQVDLADPLADVDVGVVFRVPGVLEDAVRRVRLYTALYGQLAGVFPEDKLDLVFLDETHAVFQARAVAGRCVYSVSERFKDEYEHRILARAADFRPVLERYLRERLQDVAP